MSTSNIKTYFQMLRGLLKGYEDDDEIINEAKKWLDTLEREVRQLLHL